jgi:glutathione S-transferase
MTPLFWQLVRTHEAERDPAVITAAERGAATTWGLLDAHLASHPFVAGDAFTMGDIPVGALCHRWLSLPCARPALAHLEGWSRRLQGRAAYQAHVMVPLT